MLQAFSDIKKILTFSFVLCNAMLLMSFGVAQTLEVTMTAYSSEAAQTAGDPHITATGERVGPGTLAASRDLLNTELPYGTIVRVVEVDDDPNACGGWEPDMLLKVKDTMHPRMQNRVDIWVPSRQEAIAWGRCKVVLEVVSTPG